MTYKGSWFGELWHALTHAFSLWENSKSPLACILLTPFILCADLVIFSVRHVLLLFIVASIVRILLVIYIILSALDDLWHRTFTLSEFLYRWKLLFTFSVHKALMRQSLKKEFSAL